MHAIMEYGSKWVIATTYRQNRTNELWWGGKEVDRNPNFSWRKQDGDGDGLWTPYDMALPPFDFPPPAACSLAHAPSSMAARGARTHSGTKHDYDHQCLYRLTPAFRAHWLRAHGGGSRA